jgi:electron transfer flavoprotein alpha subunit
MSFVWTIAEQYRGTLKAVSYELLSRGRRLADTLETKLASVVIGDAVSPEGLEELVHRGADEVYYVRDPRLAEFVCENYAGVLKLLIGQYRPSIILAAATSTGRTLMPYLAITVNTGLTADCTDLEIEEGTGNLLQTRPAIGGNIMATIKTPNHRPQMATVRPRSSRPLPVDKSRVGKIIEVSVTEEMIDGRVEVLGYRIDEGDLVNLEAAEVVVAGGKGMKRADNFSLIRDLAARLRGAVGASRDAVDRGWIAYPHQVGLSGKTISPKLYLCAGISGSIQHLAGIKTSETIVAINIDPEANIHKVADFSIVGDLFTVIPEIQRRLADRPRKTTAQGRTGGQP